MENEIACLTEVSADSAHLTKVAIYSFIETNPWFDGTIYLAEDPFSPLKGFDLTQIKSIYPKIQVVSLKNSPIYQLLEKQNPTLIRARNFSIALLKTLIFNLPTKRVLYFSNTSLFLNSVNRLLIPNKLVLSKDSLFYLSKDISDITIQKYLDFLETSQFFSPAELNQAFYRILNDESTPFILDEFHYSASYFTNSKFNLLSPKLKHAEYLNFDTFLVKNLNFSRINSVWLQKKQQVANFLNKPTAWLQKKQQVANFLNNPSLSSKVALKSIKSQLMLKNNASPHDSSHRQSIQKINAMFGHKVFIEHDETIENLSNKSICVVANSSDLLDYNYGPFIDSHDIVVRFNGYKIIPEKTGIKTSVHCVFREYRGKHDPAAPLKLIISKGRSSWTTSIVSFHAKDAAYRNYQIIDFNYPSDYDMKAANCDNLSIPTSGICLYAYLVSLGLRDNVRLVGFNGYNGGDPTTILRENDDFELARAHNYEMESQFWSSQFVNILPGVLKSK
jgi:hypothetical protein